mmetsp:Transcript_24509/g.30804  ORF Transcript_24509/g.30804 Transcript_24509/m.30804 type:complete len:104 (+) Transcript_24509:57-368(+)|eukprot:CAMPEP_0203637844 /NCGR_PEP_ID=MMETSP0088-20131115/4051_1 /ASSEMBLY_ACC=CAM_ASM_001087 /TAXON_ID=426623 /ORGANISM="Chaetoceros affinis, Strain CCMP159" /LENGTH=103 /DNA_ID=CAMNT_0050492373 /DNA_START=178 /DNA_END=489 /DNA_ORIENTATION=+
MVKVWYQPPPFGPRTSLNRPSYGISGDVGPRWVVQISKMPPGRVICGFIAGFVTLAYIPLLGQKLPHTLSPEYLAAQRAYMRYHNMNPIWGISSKEARASDDH